MGLASWQLGDSLVLRILFSSHAAPTSPDAGHFLIALPIPLHSQRLPPMTAYALPLEKLLALVRYVTTASRNQSTVLEYTTPSCSVTSYCRNECCLALF